MKRVRKRSDEGHGAEQGREKAGLQMFGSGSVCLRYCSPLTAARSQKLFAWQKKTGPSFPNYVTLEASEKLRSSYEWTLTNGLLRMDFERATNTGFRAERRPKVTSCGKRLP